MNLTFDIPTKKFEAWIDAIYANMRWHFVALLAFIFSWSAIIWSFLNDTIVSYGDAESHLNIAKRVVSSITPGFAQLGGIWLPLPHIMMLPFIWIDVLWQTGLAGSIVSSFCYIVSAVFIFKTTGLLTRNRWAGLFASLVFMLNPNILYMQTTPMTEMSLIMYFVLSIYFSWLHTLVLACCTYIGGYGLPIVITTGEEGVQEVESEGFIIKDVGVV